MSTSVCERVTILNRRELVRGYVRLELSCEPLARSIAPGQFITIGCGDPREMFLRRPFSLHRWMRDDGGNPVGVEILFHAKGRGTRWLAGLDPGDSVDIMGPLGTGFRYPTETGSAALIVAGGIGVAPLPAFIERLHEQGHHVTVLLGARSADGLLCEKELRALGAEVEIATEDGSRGRRGVVSHLAEEKLAEGEPTVVYACGPGPMLAAVAEQAAARNITCQVSLEAAMGCGVGACMGCVVPAADGGRRRVCTEGPVFDANEIDWPRYVDVVRRAGL